MQVDSVGSSRGNRQISPFQELIKRGFDLIGSFFALLLLSPLVVLVILLTMLVSRHSLLSRLKYYDFNGQPFELFQIRCSGAGADHGGSRLDQFVSHSSFNEILLLINVCRGDVSLVGPRPLPKSWVAAYRARIPPTYLRGVRPGLVSWGQVGRSINARDALQGKIERFLLSRKSILLV
jgi:lipopolysaccharide/colanic/teichoic acid biosynthesis glycosyltransferase